MAPSCSAALERAREDGLLAGGRFRGETLRGLDCSELDLKALARVNGNKSVELLPLKELLPVTGYVRGGCSPVGMKKRFPTYIDASAERLPRIAVSAGARGVQLFLAPADLAGAVDGVFAALTMA